MIGTSLLISKVCQNKLNHTVEVCGNLNLAENEGIQKEVQKHVADFEATFGVISIIPR